MINIRRQLFGTLPIVDNSHDQGEDNAMRSVVEGTQRNLIGARGGFDGARHSLSDGRAAPSLSRSVPKVRVVPSRRPAFAFKVTLTAWHAAHLVLGWQVFAVR